VKIGTRKWGGLRFRGVGRGTLVCANGRGKAKGGPEHGKPCCRSARLNTERMGGSYRHDETTNGTKEKEVEKKVRGGEKSELQQKTKIKMQERRTNPLTEKRGGSRG